MLSGVVCVCCVAACVSVGGWFGGVEGWRFLVSLFRNTARSERRDINMADWIRGIDDSGWRTKAGVVVTPDTALKHGAVWASVNLLASIVSNLPVDVFRGSGVSKTAVSPQPQLVASPSLILSRREWMYQAMVSMLLRGNAYGAVVERDSLLRPRTVEWLNADVVTVNQESSLHRPTYEVGGSPVPADDIIHLRAFVRAGSAIGMSPVEYQAEKIGVGLAAEKFGAQWFGDGAHPSAILQNTGQKTISQPDATTIKERFLAVMKGKREPLVLASDWKYTPIQVSANESQFLESMGYSDAQIARLYGPGVAEILGFTQSGSSLTYSNRVDRSLDLLTYSVLPWVNKFEDFLTGAIAQPQTVRFNVASLLRADPKAQREMFRIDREIGLHSIDEIRSLLDEPPLPDGQGEDYTPLKAAPSSAPGEPNAE